VLGDRPPGSGSGVVRYSAGRGEGVRVRRRRLWRWWWREEWLDLDLKRNLVGLGAGSVSAPAPASGAWGSVGLSALLSAPTLVVGLESNAGAWEGEADLAALRWMSGFIELRMRRRLGEAGESVIVAQPC
jgi:hypothetical protein